jgi:adenylate cyclase
MDDVLRRARFRQTGRQIGDVLPPDLVAESLAARVLRKFGRPDLIPEGFEPTLFRYTAPPGFGYKPHPIGDVLSPKVWERNYRNGAAFQDKIVLIGPTAEIFHDTHRVPFNLPSKEMAGPEIHLNIIGAALHGEFLTEPTLPACLAVIFLAGALAAALCFLVQQPIKRLLVVLLLIVAYAGLAGILFIRAGTAARVVLVTTPLLVLLLSSITTLAYDYLLERFEKRRIRRTLERYVSRDVVKELLDNPQTYFNALGGVRKPVTILFSDVRGFTTLTENADSAALVKQLNEYFEEMVSLVFAHQGSLDKFIGDAVMAVWGNIVSHGAARDAHNAVATALAMKRSLKKLNEDWKARGMLELAFGIGLNHGEVIVGNLGSSEKMELTVIGDSVNLASRLEGLTKEYHLDLLLGESMAKLVGDQYILRLVDCVQVKGKTKPVDVYTVMGEGAGQTVSLPLWLARYEEGVRLYRSRKFQEAAALFEECHRRDPEDYLSEMYLKRCTALIENPPDDSCNGVFVMTNN